MPILIAATAAFTGAAFLIAIDRKFDELERRADLDAPEFLRRWRTIRPIPVGRTDEAVLALQFAVAGLRPVRLRAGARHAEVGVVPDPTSGWGLVLPRAVQPNVPSRVDTPTALWPVLFDVLAEEPKPPVVDRPPNAADRKLVAA